MARGAIVRALAPVDLFYVAGEAADESDTLRMLKMHLPDVAVIGHAPPVLSGQVIIERAHSAHPRTRLIVLVDHADIALARKLLRLGAAGCLPLTATSQELIAGVVAAAFVDIPPPWDVLFPGRSRRRGRSSAHEPSRQLSARECEVLQLLADGITAKQIASRLVISTATVRTHLARIYEKLGTPSAAAAVAEALRLGMVT